MYATIRSYTGAGDLVDALVEDENAVRDLVSGLAGFKAYYMVRADDGGAVSVSVFDDRSSADESNAVAAAFIRDNLPGISVGAPQVSSGEVAISF